MEAVKFTVWKKLSYKNDFRLELLKNWSTLAARITAISDGRVRKVVCVSD